MAPLSSQLGTVLGPSRHPGTVQNQFKMVPGRSQDGPGQSGTSGFCWVEVANMSVNSPKTVCWEKRLDLRRVAKCGFCTLRDTYKYGYFKVMLSGKLFRYSRENIVFYLKVAYISGT